MDHCGRHLSVRYALALEARDCNVGREHDHARGGHDHDCNQGRGRVVGCSWQLLRNEMTRDYLAIT